MCDLKTSGGKNCATCADASTPGHLGNCGECLTVEMKTKVPYTKWQPRGKEETSEKPSS